MEKREDYMSGGIICILNRPRGILLGLGGRADGGVPDGPTPAFLMPVSVRLYGHRIQSYQHCFDCAARTYA